MASQSKAVKDLNDWCESAFKEGICTCTRCSDNGNFEEGYAYRHSFLIGDQIFSRRFATTPPITLLTSLSSAWLSYFKDHLVLTKNEAIDNDKLMQIINPGNYNYLIELLVSYQVTNYDLTAKLDT